MTKSNANGQGNLGGSYSENLTKQNLPNQISNEIHVWTQIMEQKKTERITKMREEIDNKFETILKEIKNNKSVSTATNHRSEAIGTQDTQQSGSKTNASIGFHASSNVISHLEKKD